MKLYEQLARDNSKAIAELRTVIQRREELLAKPNLTEEEDNTISGLLNQESYIWEHLRMAADEAYYDQPFAAHREQGIKKFFELVQKV